MNTETAQAFPCEVDDDACLHCEISEDNSFVDFGLENENLEWLPSVALGPSQIDNLIEFLQRMRQQMI